MKVFRAIPVPVLCQELFVTGSKVISKRLIPIRILNVLTAHIVPSSSVQIRLYKDI